jgi:gluconate 2-dehydrogenase gamma chain
MSAKGKSRRSFLISSVGSMNAAWVAAHYHDILAAQQYATKADAPKLTGLTSEQAVEVEAIADQIIPTDDTPGAREARCLHFIDRALSTFDKSKQPVYVQGLQDLQAKTTQLFPDAGKFSALAPAQQIKVLTEIEKTPFFNAVRTHTVIGFLSRPVHGGNHDKVGWKLIGYEDSLNHKPPFGFYDAAALTTQSGGGEKQ